MIYHVFQFLLLSGRIDGALANGRSPTLSAYDADYFYVPGCEVAFEKVPEKYLKAVANGEEHHRE